MYEKITAEIKRLLLEEHGFEDGEAERGYDFCLQDMLCFISTIEQHSEDLDDAAKHFVGYDMDCDELRDYETGISAFKAGAEWQKEQMMKDAEEAEIGYFNQRGLSIRTERSIERMPYDEGDKVKIIIIKEDAK